MPAALSRCRLGSAETPGFWQGRIILEKQPFLA